MKALSSHRHAHSEKITPFANHPRSSNIHSCSGLGLDTSCKYIRVDLRLALQMYVRDEKQFRGQRILIRGPCRTKDDRPGPKRRFSQRTADFHRFTPFPGKSTMWTAQETAENRSAENSSTAKLRIWTFQIWVFAGSNASRLFSIPFLSV